MHYRIIDLTTDEQVFAKPGFNFVMFDDGSIGEVDSGGDNFDSLGRPYVIEFAFQQDNLGWIYEHSVVFD